MVSLVEGLDIVFTSVREIFGVLFWAIPENAITFLIGILLYGFMGILTFLSKEKGILWKFVWAIFWLFTFLNTLWGLGLLMTIPDFFSIENLAEFVLIMFSILIFFGIGLGFYKKNPHLRKIILILLWGFFLIFTWVFPENETEFIPKLIQTIILIVIFLFPLMIELRTKFGQVENKE